MPSSEQRQVEIQTLILPKKHWTKASATKWVKNHGFKTGLDETNTSYRFRQKDPSKFTRLRTFCINPNKDTQPGSESCRVKAVGGPTKKSMEAGMKKNQEETFVTSGKVVCGLPVQIEGIEEAKRRITFIASDETVDRYGTVIAVDGWELKNFKKNPVFLFGHNYYTPSAVIGRVYQVVKDITNKQLKIGVEFVPKDINPIAEMVFQMYVGKFLHAVSVGFIPFDWETNGDMDYEKAKEEKKKGRMPKWGTYKRQELLEVSSVIVPANPTALVDQIDQAKAAGVDSVSLMAARAYLPEIGMPEEIAQLNARMEEWICQNGLCAPVKSAEEPEDPPCECQDGAEKEENRVGSTISAKNRQTLSEALEMLAEAAEMVSTVMNAGKDEDEEDDDDDDDDEKESVSVSQEEEPDLAKALAQFEQSLTGLVGNVTKLLEASEARNQKLENFLQATSTKIEQLRTLVVQKDLDNVGEEAEQASVAEVLSKWAVLGESQEGNGSNGSADKTAQ